MHSTIYALSSAAGRAAVSVIRISGAGVATILSDMTGGVPTPRQAVLRNIVHPETAAVLDQGLVLYFPAPNSATGEDLAEFHLHGGRAVLQATFEGLATYPNCRVAEPGEFAQRGFENGKIDLTSAEGIADLIDAETEAQRRQAQRQAGGALAEIYEAWRSRLIQAQALVEAAIDFSDEGDVGEKAYLGAREITADLSAAVERHLAAAKHGEIIRSGYRVVIAGPPNAGKSSLLNTLAKRDAAIVSAVPGTTRDLVEIHLDLGGMSVIITDTAGLRETTESVELEGIRRAVLRAQEADLVLWLRDATNLDGSEQPAALASIPAVEINNKIDLVDCKDEQMLAHLPCGTMQISVKTGVGIDRLIEFITSSVQQTSQIHDQAIPTNARHTQHLSQAALHIREFLTADISDLELRAEDLRMATSALGRLTGRIDVEDILDEIFSRFCVGK